MLTRLQPLLRGNMRTAQSCGGLITAGTGAGFQHERLSVSLAPDAVDFQPSCAMLHRRD